MPSTAIVLSLCASMLFIHCLAANIVINADIPTGNEKGWNGPCKSFLKENTNPRNLRNYIINGQRLHRNLRQNTINGLHPDDIKKYYGFPTSMTAGSGNTIAIVDPYDNPNAESDLEIFSSMFGLPSCTTANGCFKKVNATGGSTFTSPQNNWSSEISLDIQWAHAIAPGAKILLVLAANESPDLLIAAVGYAKAHAQYVSMSWGSSESPAQTQSTIEDNFIQPGVSFFAASGDKGALVNYPASSPHVIAVGGTSLSQDGNEIMVETGWSNTGGGCSAYSMATSAQLNSPTFSQSNCGSSRGVPDVSLLADPNPGVAVYDSYGFDCAQTSCWRVYGGTSLAAPVWAARAAVANIVVSSSTIYETGQIALRDIIIGTSKSADSPTLSCQVGYDLVTGLGSWNETTSIIVVKDLGTNDTSSNHSTAWIFTYIILLISLMY